jgi:hypothetical protein
MAHLGDDSVKVLQLIVEAFDEPDASGQREPLYHFLEFGGGGLDHHSLEGTIPAARTDIEELARAGFIDIDYGEMWAISPLPRGRKAVRDYAIASATELETPADAFLHAAAEQANGPNPLAWPLVRELLAGLRQYWQAVGLPSEGLKLPPLLHALPEEHGATTAAAIRSLISNRFLEARSSVTISDNVPVLVDLTPSAFEALDGWPSENPAQLYEHLIAAFTSQAEQATDPERKRRLRQVVESLREVGVATASEVLAKVITGD